ncbi:MAG: twin transmembrane helix small protein [Siculibacillus sp.]
MSWLVDGALAAALIAVLVVLGLGVLNMAKGGAPQRSQTLMRMRVGLQALALVLLFAVLFLRG